MGTIEILLQSSQTTFRRIDRRDAMTRRSQLHRLPTGRSAKVEHVYRRSWNKAGGQGGGEAPYPPRPPTEAWEVSHGSAFDAHMARRKRHPAVLGCIGL